MTTLFEQGLKNASKPSKSGAERREHRRHDLEQSGITVERWDGARNEGKAIGQLVDLSAGGVRIRTDKSSIKADGQIRVKLALPDYAGICPFVDTSSAEPKPKREWIGWMTVSRVMKIDGERAEVAGRLVDMEDIDRGMLGLYLSTQPLAA